MTLSKSSPSFLRTSLLVDIDGTFNTNQTYFDWIHSDPERSADLNTCMKAMRSTRMHWTEWYPVQTELFDGASLNAHDVLLVDVGGGQGHDFEKFARQFPSAKGGLVLQDLPQTLAEIKGLKANIEMVPHDFFAAQTVLGEFYYSSPCDVWTVLTTLLL